MLGGGSSAQASNSSGSRYMPQPAARPSASSSGPHGYPAKNWTPLAPEFRDVTLGRLRQMEGGNYGSLNLSSVLFEDRQSGNDVVSMQVWTPENGKPRVKPTFEQAVRAKGYVPFHKGDKLGPSWTNHWVKVTLRVPDTPLYSKAERVQFEFDPSCEAMIYSTEGLPLQGITGGFGVDRRVEYILSHRARTSVHHFYIEVSCNGMFGVDSPNEDFELKSADIVIPRMSAWHLLWDFRVLRDLASTLPSNSSLGNKAMMVAVEIANTFDSQRHESIETCRTIAEKVLGKGWQALGSKVYDEDTAVFKPQVIGMGNCHIDNAWLWPVSCTQQKVARSWSTQCDLMRRYPEYKFVASQAQQYKYCETLYPQLFEVIRGFVDKGSFRTIGGTWVEMDTNMPSGEALCRQFLFGQSYFKSRFGKYCETFWLPDSFGYSTQLPQLARSAGMPFFFTQKLSWSQFNDFPRTSFNWVGLDGTQIVTHMTPVNTYTAQASVDDVNNAVKRHKDLQSTDTGLLAFGNGDGGGGPLAQMLEGLRRIRAVANNADNSPDVPKVTMNKTVDEFYKDIVEQTNAGRRLATWQGELYLELHRGTLTSHAPIKRYNRKLERLLHDIEYFATLASLANDSYRYPKAALDKVWETVLTNQFHDVLPGSAIGMVYDDAMTSYAKAAVRGKKLLELAFEALLPGSSPTRDSTKATHTYQATEGNSDVDHARRSSAALGDDYLHSPAYQNAKGEYVLSDQKLRATFSSKGRLVSLRDIKQARELILAGRSGGLVLFQDRPLNWDAWDVDVFHLETPTHLEAHEVMLSEDEQSVSLTYMLGQSRIELNCKLGNDSLEFAAKADWKERHVFLKFELPTTLRADSARFETQFGFISRPTHRNTTWDAAKFEVCGHRFADLSEATYGIALLTDCKYGYAVEGSTMRLSLLRASTYPDPQQDQGTHTFRFAVYLHACDFLQSDVVRVAAKFNDTQYHRIQIPRKPLEVLPSFVLHGAGNNVVLDTIKRGESDDYESKTAAGGRSVILRFYEALGGTRRFEVHTNVAFKSATFVDILERPNGKKAPAVSMVNGLSRIKLIIGVFQVITLKLDL
ncbi:glycoside hydrolase family 38 protein [Mixia osmundae IAM 14324]|uniref:Alpha-mannosidase n=1 Tax=Mixia osmundae (strain CBS 9802 / IAM 14324 / JCM 22182 / KY 12970) TaxID=764103 RepID=G7E4R0_MIXOS|nr:glycoside hydrolase family 38 protein [Mixia osmundae IAM 14324]KEI37642.1 glycoside hydrolase family 38 protein [Mixia osmundae IAM 14324]GAA97820.1 hypothetical protein E5Q_04499 [Mixia osmundae IAM 14324]